MKTAVILAAGKGKKMWPYHEYHPKAALPVGGIPNILRLVKQLQAFESQQIIIVTSHLHRKIRYIVGEEEHVSVVTIDASLGTADSLEKVIDQVASEDVLVVYGDIVMTDQVLKRLIDGYRTKKYDGVALVNPLDLDQARSQDWMCVQTSPDGLIHAVYGHPRSHYVNHRLMGIFALRTEELRDALQKNPGIMMNVNVGAMPHLEAELEQSLHMLVEDGKQIYAVSAENEAVDMDKPWHIMEANKLITEHEVKPLTEDKIPSSASIHPSAEISGNVILGEDVVIGKNVIIEGNAVIGDRTVIDNGAIIEANTIIGKDSVLTNYCQIGEHSVIGHKNRFGHCAEFQGVTFDSVSFMHFGEVFGVIGAFTDIAAGVTAGNLRFDDLDQLHQIDGRRETPRQFSTAAFIGDYTRTGINVQLLPGVKIGANCAVGPGVMVTEDVPSKSLLYVEQSVVRKDWGPERYGW